MQSTEERGAERLMDDYLKSLGFHRKKIAKDGSCLFRAVAEQVLHSQSLHTEVRTKCVEFLRRNRESYEAFIEGDFEDYLCKLQDPQQWVGEVEINALAVMYKRDFQIYQEPGRPAVQITDNNFKDKVRLCFLNGNHYDSVYPVSRIKSAALCQSVLYELLYDGVFNVDRGLVSSCQRAGRHSDVLSDDNMAACLSSDESDQDGGEALWVENGTSTTAPRHNNQSYRGRGRGRLPERVRRSLNPMLLRNVEYDVWHKTNRAQQRLDYCIAAGMQFTVGDRCQVRLEGGGRSYNATVKEVPPNNGPVTVYIEELGKKQVPLWNLRPPSDENSWSTVVTREKKLSNGHGEWEERGKGRGRGKHVAASSSVAPATTPGSGGRVQKQHSWPQQVATEEPAGSKVTRRSVSTVDAAFGLSDEQRLAKKEEERNVALVELGLRDEQSFPALGAQLGSQGDGGKKKGGDKRRSQRNKTKSPVEDVRAPSPSAGERPKSSSPPLAAPAAPAVNTTAPTTTSSSSSPPAAKPPAAPPSNSNATAPSSTPSCAAPTAKTNTPSTPTSPPAAPSTKRSLAGGAVPPSVPSSASLFPVLPPALPAAASPPALHKLSSPSPPTSSASPPTFIAPIAPSPAAAQGFLPRCSPPPSSLPHSPSPPSFTVHHLREAPGPPPASAQTTKSLPNVGSSQTRSQTSSSPVHPQESQTLNQAQIQTQIQTSLPPNQMSAPQMQSEAQTPHPQSQFLPQSQPEVVQVQSPLPAPGGPHPHTSLPISVQPHPSVSLPHPHVPPAQPAHPPHPPVLPPPSLSLQTQTPHTQNHPEAPPPPAQPHPESPAPAPSQQSHPPPPSQHLPQVQAAAPPPPAPQAVPGAVPLQQLSQLYQDPVYPGFPQSDKGDIAPTPPFSFNQSGDDLPRDLNVLRFFFNLGLKAYTIPICPPYVYLLPLQQAHTLQPRPPSRSPSPAPPYAPPTSSARHQEPYPHPPYPPTSASIPPQYDAEPPLPADPSFSQAGYPAPQPPPPPHRLPWQQQQQIPPPRNPAFQGGYPTPSPPYPVPSPLPQGYLQGQGPAHPVYTQTEPPYPPPPSSLGYQAPPPHEDLKGSKGPMEQRLPAGGDSMSGLVAGRVPGPSASLETANNRTVLPVPYGRRKEPSENLMLLVDPPLNPNHPILVSKDTPVSMMTMKTSSTPGSPLSYDIMSKPTVPGDSNLSRGYRGHQKPLHPAGPYLDPGQVGFLSPVGLLESQSVGCNTEEDGDEPVGFKPGNYNYRGPRRGRGGRGRGGHDPGRGAPRRRPGPDPGPGPAYIQYNSSYRGRGRERGLY